MVETHDPAGWYPDPAGKHELRYWDGYAWLDNVSDQGATSEDALGGKPYPPPSQVAARQQVAPAAPAAKSKTPIVIAVVAAVVVVGAAVYFLFLRDSGGGGATALRLGKPLTFNDDGKDAAHPIVHTVDVESNRVVTIRVKSDDDSLTPAVIVEADQKVVDSVNSRISGASDVLTGKLQDACSNLREEDIGAKGSVAYVFGSASSAGSELRTFAPMPVGGNFEFIPLLVDDKGDCKAGKLTMTLEVLKVDQSNASDLSDLDSVLSDVSELSDFTD